MLIGIRNIIIRWYIKWTFFSFFFFFHFRLHIIKITFGFIIFRIAFVSGPVFKSFLSSVRELIVVWFQICRAISHFWFEWQIKICKRLSCQANKIFRMIDDFGRIAICLWWKSRAIIYSNGSFKKYLEYIFFKKAFKHLIKTQTIDEK